MKRPETLVKSPQLHHCQRTRSESESGRGEGGKGEVLHGREAAQRRHICRSINFLLRGTRVSTLAAGARQQPCWSSDGGLKTSLHRAGLCSNCMQACVPPPPKYIHSESRGHSVKSDLMCTLSHPGEISLPCFDTNRLK